ncbi:zinc ribbon domain-containing protein [Nanoarchaeota archaeon]
MEQCKGCNSRTQKDDGYCRYCGEELPDKEVISCPECEAEVYLEDNYCHSCGTQFEGLEESDEEEAEEDDSDEEIQEQLEAESTEQPPGDLQPNPVGGGGAPPQGPQGF